MKRLGIMMPWQFIEHHRRHFQALFYSMEKHYELARDLYKKVHNQDPKKPNTFDQYLEQDEKAEARSSFIMGIAGIEAFTNNILKDFKKRNRSDIQRDLLNEHQKSNSIKRWHLIDKVYFLPTLCNTKYLPPDSYFKLHSRDFLLFQELIKIRNSIMHGKANPLPVLIKFRPNRVHEYIDSLEENIWPISKIHRDFSSFNFRCAKVAYRNIRWMKNSLIRHIKEVNKSYMKDQVIELKSRVITDKESSQEQLLNDSNKYILDKPVRTIKVTRLKKRPKKQLKK